MALDINNAIAAYGNTQRAGGQTSEAAGRKTDPGTNFADMVRQSAQEARQTLQTSEEVSLKAVKGEAQLHEVVTAVSAAEVTLQTVVAVRDKVTQAYQEILRMPI